VPFATAEALVRQQYLDFKGRAATSTEVSTAATKIKNCTQTADAFIATLLPTDLTTTDAQLVRLYHAFFKRAPDSGGFNYWTSQIDTKGKSIATVAQSFATLSEFKNTYGSLSNSAFVDLVYRNVLDRPSEPAGKAFWVKQLDNKTRDRGQVMTNFSESSENRRIRTPLVETFRVFRAMRLRLPTTPELTTLTAQRTAVANTPVTITINAIRTSTAYAGRF
jgi:hypothetical protein